MVLCIYLLLDILGASNSIKCLSLLQGSYFKPFYLSKKGWKGWKVVQSSCAPKRSDEIALSFIVVLRRLVNATPSATWTPSGCCNRPTFCRLLTAYRRKSIAADPAGYLPCLGSSPWHCRWCRKTRLPTWWFCQSKSWRRFASRLSNATPSATWTPSGCCNRPKFCRLLTAYRRKSIAADPVEFLFFRKREEKKRSALKPLRERKKTQRQKREERRCVRDVSIIRVPRRKSSPKQHS